jgi:membrane-associated PAP2 superfamily phosphatase
MTRWLPLIALAVAAAVALLLATYDAAEPLHVLILAAGVVIGFLLGMAAGIEWERP